MVLFCLDMKTVIGVVLIFVIAAGTVWFWNQSQIEGKKSGSFTVIDSVENGLGAKEAEHVGFSFILRFIESAPPTTDVEAAANAYEYLSMAAKAKINPETLSRDLAGLVGVQDIPDQGASVEDLQMKEDGGATLIVGLNYSGGRVLRALDMIVENGAWKVDVIRPLEQYP